MVRFMIVIFTLNSELIIIKYKVFILRNIDFNDNKIYSNNFKHVEF